MLSGFSFWHSNGTPRPGLAAAVEEAGFPRLWLGNAPPDLREAEQVLAETATLSVATGIVNIWRADARALARRYHDLEDRYPGRFLLGIGIGHRESVRQYARPYEAITAFLDALSAAGVPPQRQVLAALGPRVLRLAARRAAGAVPYLVPAAHTAQARALMGPQALLVPEHFAVLEADRARARAIGRAKVQAPYLSLENYRSNLKRLGFTDADLDQREGGSDRLIDAVVAYGDPDEVAARLGAHLEAGADEVAVNLLTGDPRQLREHLTTLSAALRRWEAAYPARRPVQPGPQPGPAASQGLDAR